MYNMSKYSDKISIYWANRPNVLSLASALENEDPALASPSPDDLASRDQMHAGTMDATKKFAEWSGVSPRSRVLDLGSGLGGSARYLAREMDARVVALDLCRELCETGEELTRRSGLAGRVVHLCGDFDHPDVEANGPYDAIWIQHVDMQVEDKVGLYRACAASLAPNGRVIWHDWLSGKGGEPRWPMFWSEDGGISHARSEDEFRRELARAGLLVTRLEPIEDLTVSWFDSALGGIRQALNRLESTSDPRHAKRRSSLEKLSLEMTNAIANIREDRLVPFFGEARARSRS